MAGIKALLKDTAHFTIHDVTQDASLLGVTLPGGTTVGAEPANHVAVTSNLFSNDKKRTRIHSDVYLGQGFFGSNPDWQGMTVMHELLHALLKEGDAKLESDLGTGGLGVSTWIERGCP